MGYLLEKVSGSAATAGTLQRGTQRENGRACAKENVAAGAAGCRRRRGLFGRELLPPPRTGDPRTHPASRRSAFSVRNPLARGRSVGLKR
jgi:hypothetical protein